MTQDQRDLIMLITFLVVCVWFAIQIGFTIDQWMWWRRVRDAKSKNRR